ncbi:MAG: energy transducer TonB [Verrucomicrobiota bacterium]
MRLAFKKNPPFWTSVILHLVVLLCLFLGTIVEAFRPKEPVHVFEMVSPPAETAEESSEPASEPPPPVELPEVAPLEPLPDIEISEPAPPEPAPAPRERPEPKPAEPEPKRMSYEEFLKQNPVKEPKPQPVRSKPKFNRPVIDAPKLVIPDATAQNPNPQQLSQSDMNELAAYNARLRARLDAAWNKPENLGGVRIEATVRFDVSAGGRITNVRLVPSSGNAAFDQSVKAAFSRIADAGPTPTRQGHTFSMTFRMVD